uniref:Uncharacterized protein n=1 Tax=Anguilla anguilla TaxID=7936 RepID=A0A0E9U815_ANGAN
MGTTAQVSQHSISEKLKFILDHCNFCKKLYFCSLLMCCD